MHVLRDAPGREGDKAEGQWPGERVVAGVADARARHLVAAVPAYAAIEPVAAEADGQAWQDQGAHRAGDGGAGNIVVEGVDHQGAAGGQRDGVDLGQLQVAGLDPGLHGAVEAAGEGAGLGGLDLAHGVRLAGEVAGLHPVAVDHNEAGEARPGHGLGQVAAGRLVRQGSWSAPFGAIVRMAGRASR